MNKLYGSVTADRARPDEWRMTITTQSVDREGDEVVTSGIDVSTYLKRNPVLLWSHSYEQIPIGSCTSLDVQPTRIIASGRWLENDEFASRVKNAWNQGVLRSCSIGFRVLKSERN